MIRYIIVFGIQFFLLAEVCLASVPQWVSARPISRDFYIGIGACNKKEFKVDCRKIAEDKAFLEIASEISVDVTGSFVQKIVERTGLSEQNVRQEIQTSSQAKLTGHELVGEWEDRKNHWVYFRLSKKKYLRQLAREKEKAVSASVDMLAKAVATKKAGDPVSALRFYFEALARVQDYIGENIQTTFQNRSIFLFNEIYTDIQLTMASIRLRPQKNRLPALAGEPVREPIRIAAIIKNEHGQEIDIVGLPIRFNSRSETIGFNPAALSDDQGLAKTDVESLTSSDHGKQIKAHVDVAELFPETGVGGIFHALINKLTIPETSITINIFNDKDTYYWHQAFEGKRVIVLSAYQTKDASGKWAKIGDELHNFLKAKGANIVRLPNADDIENTILLSKNLDSEWYGQTSPQADYIFVMAAVGRMNKRENAKNPFGEDVQFAGEIRTSVHQSGKLNFADKYKGATGWNPLGEEMVMDVLALHVFKRWQQQYLQRLKD